MGDPNGSKVFASDDIATLIANFPPLTITESGRPVAVRSFSGNALKSSNDVLAAFKKLIETHNQRINKAELAAALGIERDGQQFVLDEVDSQLYYSRDGRDIIPIPVIESIAQQLKSYGSRTCVDLNAFAADHDIGIQSLDRLVELYTGKDWPRVIIDVDNRSFVCSLEFSESVKTHINNAISDAGNEMCDLSTVLGNGIPSPIIVALATEATASSKGGEVKLAGDHVVYVPAGYSREASLKIQQLRSARLADLVQQLADHGFCLVEESPGDAKSGPAKDSMLDEAVLAEFEKAHPNSARTQVVDLTPEAQKTAKGPTPAHDTKLLVDPKILDHELGALQRAIATRTEIIWRSDPAAAKPSTIIQSLVPSDFATAHNKDLANLLLRSSAHHALLEAASEQRLHEMDGARHEKFIDIIEARLWCPIHLYAAGVLEARDDTLRQNLEIFAIDHFKLEAVPKTVAELKAQGLLDDRARRRETEKLQQSVHECRTFVELQKALARLGKKLQIPTPDEELVLSTKHGTVEQTVKAMQKMTRGSDILQHLIWVLLATSGPGLFMSSGKDTSRMIKQYDAVAPDPEVAGLLAIWRDKLKSGMADEEDLRQMKELAREAVKDWLEEERTRPYSGT